MSNAAIEEFELRKEFPAKVVEEAQAFGQKVPKAEIEDEKTCATSTCFTIDPDTAKDFDDAISLTKDERPLPPRRPYRRRLPLRKTGTALDNEAQMRCNSTYFPGNCVPMLPEELPNNLCSLKAECQPFDDQRHHGIRSDRRTSSTTRIHRSSSKAPSDSPIKKPKRSSTARRKASMTPLLN